MDDSVIKSFHDLADRILKELQDELQLMKMQDDSERVASDTFISLVNEAIPALQSLQTWSTGAESLDMDDDEAMKLLASMDSPSGGEDAAASDEMSCEDEAMALLNSMGGGDDTPAVPVPAAAASSGGGGSHEDEEVVEEIPEFGQSEFASDPDMIKDFLMNSDELMETLDDRVLALEQDQSEETIEEIFRAAHTLKGAAGMFGFQSIERVMHRLENFFDQVRKGQSKATSDSTDVILKGLDVVKALIEAVREGKPCGIKTAPIVKTLNLLCAGKYVAINSAAVPEVEKDKEDKPAAKENSAAKKEVSTIRVDLQRLDLLVNLVGELVIDRTRFVNIEEQLRHQNVDQNLSGNLSETVELFGRHMNEIQDIIMKVRMVPIGNAFNKFPRVVRDLARQLGKSIDLVIEGETTELDKTLVEQIGDPLVHLVRNSVDHGIEMPDVRSESGKSKTGTVILSARQEGNQIVICIEDDGKGMDQEAIRKKGIASGLISDKDVLTSRDIFNLIFEPGFSTAAAVTNVSGRGVGMDVVKKQISKLKGVVDVDSTPGKGSVITINLPLTLAIVQSLLVQSSGEIFAIPLSTVVESLRILPSDIHRVGDVDVIKRRNMVLPLVYLSDALDVEVKNDVCWYRTHPDDAEVLLSERRESRQEDRLFVVVVGSSERRFGIVVDSLLNQQEMVIKSMGSLVKDIPAVAGGAILGSGQVVLVLDIAELADSCRSRIRGVAA
ncbi:MAG: chemotaxis protein CheA [Oligoflexales bacterium]